MIDSTFKNANILIVDDKDANVELLAGFLETLGYVNVKTTTDPRLVVDLYTSFNPDLILLDLMMPYLTGYEVMHQLKKVMPIDVYMPILVLTADITAEAKQRALYDGAKDFLSKPFDLVEVALRMENLLFARFLHQQSLRQNEILEEKVWERTLELLMINSDLVAATKKAEASDKLKTAFIKNISHEIRTPLNGILGMYQILLHPNHTEVEKENYLVHLRTSSDRLIKTISDYLEMALLVSDNIVIEKSMFSPAMLLQEVFGHHKPICSEKNLAITFTLESGTHDQEILSDRKMLKKAITYLVDNAIKYTKEGKIVLGSNHLEDKIEFFVRDTGIGIEGTALTSVFDQFMQENVSDTRGYEGSGLGLTIARKMAGRLGGSIRVESVKGVGSTFYLAIPMKLVK